MEAERVGAIGPIGSPGEPAIESTDNDELRTPESTDGPSTKLKLADRPLPSRVQRLLDLTITLQNETESLARDRAFTEESNRIQSLNLEEGIDFYSEVERFESSLIKLALDQTRGHQARAARLLHIKPTTLNSKIKSYGIEY